MTTLHRFPGGLALPPDKAAALCAPIRTMPTPHTLHVVLADRQGDATPHVQPGDRVSRGQILARSPVWPGGTRLPVLAPANGRVIRLHSGRPPSVTLEVDEAPDHRYDNPSTSTSEQRLRRLQDGGLLGLGGAAFPLTVKIDASPRVHTLIINAAECEPKVCCDEALMIESAKAIVRGIDLLRQRLGAATTLIAIEDSKPEAIREMRKALAQIPDDQRQLVIVPTRYPTGGERQLVRVLTGVALAPDQRPTDAGMLCVNVATAWSVHQWVELGEPQLSRIVTVTGTAINQPINVRVTYGTSIRELLHWVQPDLTSNCSLRVGGPLTGVDAPLTTVLSQSTPPASPVVNASTHCLIVDLPHERQRPQPCIRCGNCDDVCPAGLLPQQLHWYGQQRQQQELRRFGIDACIECGCCDLVCPSALPLTAGFRLAREHLQDEHRLAQLAERARQRFEARAQRIAQRDLARQQAIAARKQALDQSTTDATAPDDPIKAALARARARRHKPPNPR